jgi:predicted RNase H-like HicB family nuclease
MRKAKMTIAPDVLEHGVRVDLQLPPLEDPRDRLPIEDAPPRTFTAIAVREASAWASLCPELDIASVGGSAADAIEALKDAVRTAVAAAAERGIQAGRPTERAALVDFIRRADLPYNVTRFQL